jgi:hypothetical protein
MSNEQPIKSSKKLFNISKEYKKHYKLGHSSPSKNAGIPVHYLCTQVYKGSGSTPTRIISSRLC